MVMDQAQCRSVNIILLQHAFFKWPLNCCLISVAFDCALSPPTKKGFLRMLLGAPGIATRSKKLLRAPGLTTRNKEAPRSFLLPFHFS